MSSSSKEPLLELSLDDSEDEDPDEPERAEGGTGAGFSDDPELEPEPEEEPLLEDPLDDDEDDPERLLLEPELDEPDRLEEPEEDPLLLPLLEPELEPEPEEDEPLLEPELSLPSDEEEEDPLRDDSAPDSAIALLVRKREAGKRLQRNRQCRIIEDSMHKHDGQRHNQTILRTIPKVNTLVMQPKWTASNYDRIAMHRQRSSRLVQHPSATLRLLTCS